MPGSQPPPTMISYNAGWLCQDVPARPPGKPSEYIQGLRLVARDDIPTRMGGMLEKKQGSVSLGTFPDSAKFCDRLRHEHFRKWNHRCKPKGSPSGLTACDGAGVQISLANCFLLQEATRPHDESGAGIDGAVLEVIYAYFL